MKWSVNLKDKFYDKAELDSKFDALVGFTTLVVNSLPVTGKNGIMYLLPSDESTESNNIYDEYIWVSDKFEKIGSTKTTVDLSGYVTQTEMNTQLANKANTNHTHDIASLPDETDMLGHMENDFYTALDTKADKTTATTSANGLMSKEDKSKLDGIATEANKTVVDSSLSSSSTNPVQNKVVKGALDGKANSSHNHSISNITNLQSALDNKSETGHIHDDRYYTETEMNTKLDGKANTSHTHNDTYYTKDEINTRLGDIETILNEILGV